MTDGHLPSWLNSSRGRKKQNKRSARYEQELANELGGKVQPGSGSSPRARQDVKAERLVQHKYTDKSTFTLDVREWISQRDDALRTGRSTATYIDFTEYGVRLVIEEG